MQFLVKSKMAMKKISSGSKESLKILRATLLEDGSLTPAQRRRIQSTIAILVDHVSYYELTESLLTQFKTIAPELYAEIDTITDRLGRPVNVYIKFVPIDGTDVKAAGNNLYGPVSLMIRTRINRNLASSRFLSKFGLFQGLYWSWRTNWVM